MECCSRTPEFCSWTRQLPSPARMLCPSYRRSLQLYFLTSPISRQTESPLPIRSSSPTMARKTFYPYIQGCAISLKYVCLWFRPLPPALFLGTFCVICEDRSGMFVCRRWGISLCRLDWCTSSLWDCSSRRLGPGASSRRVPSSRSRMGIFQELFPPF